MQIEVTVALVGDPKGPPPGGIDPDEWTRPWDDRPKATLTVDADEPLSEVINRAAEEFGSLPFMATLPRWHSFGWVAFDDEAAKSPLYDRRISDFTLLDDHGEAVFGITDFALIPYGQIVLSAEAGLISGNPRRLYIIRQVPQGDLFGLSWETFVELYIVIRTVLDVVSTADDLKERTQSATRSVHRGLDALRRHVPRWGQRKGTPDRLRKLVQTRAWSSEELSEILACPEDDLADVLTLLGFTRDSSDGAWRRRKRDEEPVLADLEDEIKEGDYGDLYGDDIDKQRLLHDRVSEIARHGRQRVAPTPLEGYRIPEDEFFPYPSPARWRMRIVWFVERVLRVR